MQERPGIQADRPAALLLTGGASRRMGRDKAAIVVGGQPLAVRTAQLLLAVAEPCLEVGGEMSGLPIAEELLPGAGPLAAIAAGWAALVLIGHEGSVLVVATDMPRLTHEAVSWLATHDAATTSVVPVTAGRRQYLCARWSPGDLDRAVDLVAQGERKVAAALGTETTFVDESGFPPGVQAIDFFDADTPADLERLTQSP